MTADSPFMFRAREWLDRHRARRLDTDRGLEPGSPFSTAVFHALSAEEEANVLASLQKWNRERAERGFHAIAWPVDYGGLGLSADVARAYAALEAEYVAPPHHELFSVTTRLIAPTVLRFGTDEQRAEFISPFLRTDVLCCQLFSEPTAGSDLAGLATRAQRDGAEWIVNGQKVWSSGAQFAELGLLIARTDPDVPKHAGLTAFLLPMQTDGVEVRPIRQMSGGASFSEVFLTDVRLEDRFRLGEVGQGWSVALTTLGFERDHAEAGSDDASTGGTWEQVVATARACGGTGDAVARQELAALYSRFRLEEFVNQRAVAARVAGVTPGPEASLGKLMWTERMRHTSDVVSRLTGPALVADSGKWATYAWNEHVLGAPGYRIAGGSDEIQRNIVAERVLGLPAEPRVDKALPWRDVPRVKGTK